MKFTKNLENFFIISMFLATAYLLYNWNQSKTFKDNPLPKNIQNRVDLAEEKVLALIRQKYNVDLQIPLIISDEFHSNLYGLTSYKDNELKVYLNKKRFKESEDYMIEEVIPHEYAHAMVFVLGENVLGDGHTQIWQEVCIQLEGKNCVQYVDNEEIVRAKMAF